VVKYPLLIVKTLSVLIKSKSKVVFAQNPSIVLSLLVVVYGKLFHKTVVIDAHNAGLFPLEGKSRILNGLAKAIFRMARLTIVTNDSLKSYVADKGGRPIVVPDPLPEFSVSRRVNNESNFLITFICSWAQDEPYREVMEAASLLCDMPVSFSITGKYKGKVDSLSVPDNVQLTGFLDEKAYLNMLAKSDAVVVLTKRKDCMNCGAYEAVSMGLPLLLSDSQVLRNYFSKGTLFTDNSVEDIVHKLRQLYLGHVTLGMEVAELKQELAEGWESYLNDLRQAVSQGIIN
jgi:glycosyltransferase involved in cell wall biosynthesis